MSVKEKCQDFSYTSPRVTDKDSGIWDDTLGEKCHWRPHPNQHPGTHDRLHEIGFLVTQQGGDNMEEAQYGSDRLCGEQKDIRNTFRILGDRFLEVSVAETVQRKETRLKDYKSFLEDYKNILSMNKNVRISVTPHQE